MDVCTLIVAQWITLLGCMSTPLCVPSVDGTRQYCTPSLPTTCNRVEAEPAYACVRPDGTTYLLKQSEAK